MWPTFQKSMGYVNFKKAKIGKACEKYKNGKVYSWAPGIKD